MNEWTPWHEHHAEKIELIAGVDCWVWIAGANSSKTHGRVRFTDRFGKRYSEYSHRAAFISAFGKINDDAIICHKCGVGLCVRPSHLYEGSHSTNSKDMADMGTGRSMLSYNEALDVRQRYANGEGLQEIADHYGLAFGSVYPIVMGKVYKHAPFPKNYTYGNRSRKPLTSEEITGIRQMLADGKSQYVIAEKHNVAQSIVSRIKTGVKHAGR